MCLGTVLIMSISRRYSSEPRKKKIPPQGENFEVCKDFRHQQVEPLHFIDERGPKMCLILPIVCLTIHELISKT